MDFIRGLRLYEHWRRRNGFLRKGKEITAQEFITSQFYNSFMKLVQFTTDNWVITSLKYLDFLIDGRFAEHKWMSQDTLDQYRTHLRRSEDAVSQTKTTCVAIKQWCEKNEVDRREFFAKITTGSALQMVVTNQISPWVLFGYDRSVNELLSRVNDDWLHSINEHLNNAYWINKIRASQDTQHVIQAECERVLGE